VLTGQVVAIRGVRKVQMDTEMEKIRGSTS